jgi:chromosomal replication initiator protein
LGKTHLLQAIAQEVLKDNPRYPIVYVSAQQFAEKFVHALQTNKIEQFRRAQRDIGVWLLDDIQFIAGKDKTQEEIFHTFNYIHGLGKQIVLSSDRPPRDLYLMDDRLRSRFESGLVADIQSPDLETRCAILQSKAKMESIELDHNIAMLLAEAVPGNIRVLEGALIKLVAQASLESSPITEDLARMTIDRYYRQYQLPKPSVDHILELVSKHFRIPIEEIRGTSRKAPITYARHIAIYLIRDITKDSWKSIGSTFSDRDHTSIMHAHQKINELLIEDAELGKLISGFKKNFNINH